MQFILSLDSGIEKVTDFGYFRLHELVTFILHLKSGTLTGLLFGIRIVLLHTSKQTKTDTIESISVLIHDYFVSVR